MDIGAILLLVSVCFLTALFITRPFLEHRRASNGSADDQVLSSLLAERDRLIGALQDLDFDHTLGKIPADDYPAMRASLLQRAADALRRIDTLQQQPATSVDAESRVEAVIAKHRADAAVEKSQSQEFSDDDLEELISVRRASRKEKAGGFCTNCGKPVLRSDRFCPSCGKPISK